MYPLYIPSKGRSTTATTPRLCERSHVSYILVVEQQEYVAYQKYFPAAQEILVLPESNQGLWFARNWILQYEQQHGGTWHWELDDDIRSFWIQDASHILKNTVLVLEQAEKVCHDPRVAQIGISRKARKFPKVPYVENDACYTVVCNHTSRILEVGQYRPGVPEDTDMCLQLLTNGWKTLRWEHYSFDSPFNGQGEGGLHDDYANKKDSIWAENMVKLWGPELCHVVTTPAKRKRANIRWEYFSHVSDLHSK